MSKNSPAPKTARGRNEQHDRDGKRVTAPVNTIKPMSADYSSYPSGALKRINPRKYRRGRGGPVRWKYLNL